MILFLLFPSGCYQVFHSGARRRQAFAYIYGMSPSPPPPPPSPSPRSPPMRLQLQCRCYDSLTCTLPHSPRSFFVYLWERKDHDLRTCQRDTRFILTCVATPCFLRFPRRCLWLIFAGLNLVPDRASPELLV